ncbi:AzlD domain-containing protein [Fusibacter paucivorans]|jgi:branched-subunit amino acid transport protein|nr:AzlD domain-containing protein [Fusibacter paucivorans]
MMAVILGMSCVTFLPRIASMVWFKDLKPNAFWRRFFNNIPYAMLSVLIFPDVLSACGTAEASLVGVAAAALLSLMQKSATTVVLGAVISVYGFLWLF